MGLQNPVISQCSQAQCQGPGNTTAHRQDYTTLAGETARASVSLLVRRLSVSHSVLAVELLAAPRSTHSW